MATTTAVAGAHGPMGTGDSGAFGPSITGRDISTSRTSATCEGRMSTPTVAWCLGDSFGDSLGDSFGDGAGAGECRIALVVVMSGVGTQPALRR